MSEQNNDDGQLLLEIPRQDKTHVDNESERKDLAFSHQSGNRDVID